MARANVPDIRLVQYDLFPKYSVTLDWQLLPNGTLDDTPGAGDCGLRGARHQCAGRIKMICCPILTATTAAAGGAISTPS